jgi:hypothetical protein
MGIKVIQQIGSNSNNTVATVTASISTSDLIVKSISAGIAYLGPSGGLIFTTDTGIYNGRIGLGTITPQYSNAIDARMPVYFNDPIYALSSLSANITQLGNTTAQSIYSQSSISSNSISAGNINIDNIGFKINSIEKSLSSNSISSVTGIFEKIGIGTNSPLTELHINGSISGTSFTANDFIILNRVGYPISIISLTNIGGFGPGGLSISSAAFEFRQSNVRTSFSIHPNGNIGLGTGSITPSAHLHVTGSISAQSLTSVDGISGSTISANSGKLTTLIILDSISGNSICSGNINISNNNLILNSTLGSISSQNLSAGSAKINDLIVPGLLQFNSLSGNNLTANHITFISTTAIEFTTTGSMNIAGSLDVTGSNLNTFIARFNDSNSAVKAVIDNSGNIYIIGNLTGNSISSLTISGGIGKFNSLIVDTSISSNILLAGNFMVSTASLLNRINSVDSGTATNSSAISLLQGIQTNYAILSGNNIFTNSNSISAFNITGNKFYTNNNMLILLVLDLFLEVIVEILDI